MIKAAVANTFLVLERQVLDATEFLVGDEGHPAAHLVDVAGVGADVELAEMLVHESGLGADLTADVQEARSGFLPVWFDSNCVIVSEGELEYSVAYLRRKLEEVRLLVVDGEVVGGSLVIEHHGVTLRMRVELVCGVVC